MSRKVPLLAAALCAAVMLVAGSNSSLGDEASPARKKLDQKQIAEIEKKIAAAKSRIGEKQIEAALQSPTQLEFTETTLENVVNVLGDMHGIEIRFNDKALKDANIDKETPVTTNLQFVSLRSALNLMLAQLNLTYVVQDEVLLITTIEEAQGRLLTKVYPVAHLLPPGMEGESRLAKCWEPARVIVTTIATESWRSDDAASVPTPRPGTAPVRKAAGSTGSAGGGGAITATTVGNVEVLIVTQNYHVHRQLAELLEQLRKVADGK